MLAARRLPARSSRSAFTLIELVMVAVMMAMFMGIVATAGGWNQGPDYAIRERARRIAGTMEQALIETGTTGVMVKLVYDMDEQTVSLALPPEYEEGEERPDPEDEEYELFWTFEIGDPDDPERSDVWLEGVQTLDGKMHSRGVFEVLIATNGTSMGHLVHLTSGADRPEEFSIEMSPITGMAHIYQYNKKAEEPEKD